MAADSEPNVESPFETIPGKRYEVLSRVGTGSFGAVYKARDTFLSRSVAIKSIRLDTSVEPERREALNRRFLREAQVSAQLSHPNIVTIHDVMITDETGFLVMEFIEGTTLRSLLDQKTISPERCIDIVSQVARGLQYAHAHKVVHRDIKPGNILVTSSYEAHITDFGIAKSDQVSHATKSGGIVGTPDYMSPEQAAGEDVDARTDLFSLGCVLYECAVGQKPFRGNNVTAVLLSIVNSDPFACESWTRSPVSRSDEMASVLRRALAKKRDERFPSASEFLEAVERLPKDFFTASALEREAGSEISVEVVGDRGRWHPGTIIVPAKEESISPDEESRGEPREPTLDAGRFLREDDRPLALSSNLSDELQNISLTPAQGFILSRVDGTLRARDILSLSPLPEEDVAATLVDLLDRGLLMHEGEAPADGEAKRGPKSREKASDVTGRFDRRRYADELFQRAKEAYDTADYWESIQLARQAIELDQLEPAYHHLLGLGLMKNRHWLKEAEESLRKASALEPSNPRFLGSLAGLYRAKGDDQKAATMLEKAKALDPGFSDEPG